VAIAAHQRFGDRLGAGGAVEFGGGMLGLGHTAIINPGPYLAAAIEST
jgi:hypothetical protein